MDIFDTTRVKTPKDLAIWAIGALIIGAAMGATWTLVEILTGFDTYKALFGL